ncbi:MAG: hypothetical protein IJ665_02290 [Phocaeicola sp.]|nr:hypothetical protein [Phocaeicola sp.]
MGKKNWGSTKIDIQTFVPQEYIASCFVYEATLICDYGKVYPETTGGPDGLGCYEMDRWGRRGAQHGEPCANSWVQVKVIENSDGTKTTSYQGHEGGNKTDIALTNVVIPGIAELREGDEIIGATWTSTLGGTYNHQGNGIVTRWYFDEEGSNHS